jgi:hypothetical protein
MRLSVFSLLFALVAAFNIAIPTEAEAASALFRVKRSWIGGGATTPNGGTASPYISKYYHPRMVGPNKAPPAVGYIGHTTGPHRISFPSKVIKDYTRFFWCGTFMDCRPGYPVSVSFHSYHNVKGSFRPNNPYGATTTTTVMFPTTGNGQPTTPTTTFNGNYDFSRSGSIMITPGANRFGGTMKFFYGPNNQLHQTITISSPYTSRIRYALPYSTITTIHHSLVGSNVIGPRGYRYRYTCPLCFRVTTGGPSYRDYKQIVQRISTLAPWTTGVAAITADGGVTMGSARGYDNRTPNGLNGVISLVRPRLVHSYVVPHDPNLPIVKARSFAQIWQMDIHFLPEPGGAVLLGAGLLTLVGLYRFRRR